jgi:hypothetical protein
MPKYRLTQKTAPPKPKHRVTGKTSAMLTDYHAPVAAPAAHKPRRWKADTLLPRAPALAKRPPVKTVTRDCKITIERPGHAPQVYHTKSSSQVLP